MDRRRDCCRYDLALLLEYQSTDTLINLSLIRIVGLSGKRNYLQFEQEASGIMSSCTAVAKLFDLLNICSPVRIT